MHSGSMRKVLIYAVFSQIDDFIVHPKIKSNLL